MDPVRFAPLRGSCRLNFSGLLIRGVLPAKLRESIALAVGEINECDYCLSARMLTAAEVGALVPIPTDGLVGGFHGTQDLRVDPRSAAAGSCASGT